MDPSKQVCLTETPADDDRSVKTFVDENLREELFVKQFNQGLKNAGLLLYISTLAMAKNEIFIEIQEALFNIVKLEDTLANMLFSFKSSAVNILEKVQSAFSYMSEGFPDEASVRIESIKGDIEKMKEKAIGTKAKTKKNMDVTSKLREDVRKELNRTNERLHKAQTHAQGHRQALYQNENPSRTSTDSEESSWLWSSIWCCCENRGDTSLDTRGQVPVSEVVNRNVDRREEMALLDNTFQLRLTVLGLDNCVGTLKKGEYMLDQLLSVVEQWYRENKEVVVPSMEANIKWAESLSKEQRVQHWKSAAFSKEVRRFYTRWVALKIYCDMTQSELREIHNQTDAWYIDTPKPEEAVRMAWIRAKMVDVQEIKKLVEEREKRLLKTN